MDDYNFVSQLKVADRAHVTYELSCNYFNQTFSICILPSGHCVTGSGFWSFCFGEYDLPPVLFVNYTSKCCQSTRVEVKLGDSPPLTLIRKSVFSPVVVLNENDAHMLMIKRPLFQLPGSEYPIFGENDIQIGVIKKDVREYYLSFPPNLDVKYKAALLVTCILYNK